MPVGPPITSKAVPGFNNIRGVLPVPGLGRKLAPAGSLTYIVVPVAAWVGSAVGGGVEAGGGVAVGASGVAPGVGVVMVTAGLYIGDSGAAPCPDITVSSQARRGT